MGKLGELFYTIALKGMDEFKDDVEQSETQTEQSSNKIIDAFKRIGAAIATYLTVTKIIDFGKAAVEAAATVGAEVSAFEQIMGDYSDTAQQKMNEIADATGMVSTRLTPYMTSMTAKFKGLGFDIDDATTLAQDGLTLAADAAAFWDKSLDESMSHLNSFINGSYEGGEAIGLFANDTQMAAYAVETGIVSETKAWSSLDEATKQATRLEYAKNMFEQSGATGQAAKEASQYANVQANLTEKWRQFKAQIGEPILQNVVLPAMEKLSELVDKASVAFENAKVKVKELTEWYQKNKTWIDLLVIAVGSITAGMIAYQSWMAILTLKTKLMAAAQALMNSTMLASPITWIIAGIVAVVAAIIYLWNNCEWFRNMVQGLWDWLKNTFNAIWTTISNIVSAIWTTISTVFTDVWNKVVEVTTGIYDSIKEKFNAAYQTVYDVFKNIYDTIHDKIRDAKDFVYEMIEKIKGFFKFEWSLPHLKLPHVTITGEFSLMPPSVPHFGLEWYAKGGILEAPTIFGANGNTLMGGGEAGPEAVAPISELMKYVRTAVAESSANAGIESLLERILNLMEDDSRMKRIMLEVIDESGFRIVLDGREVGRIVKKYA